MVKRKGDHVPTFISIEMPKQLEKLCRNDTLCVDNCYVNGNVFVHIIIRKMKFRTIASVNRRHKIVLLGEKKVDLNIYQAKGFDITSVYADKEFEYIREDMRPIELNICPTDDPVHEVERSIRTVNERVRCTMHG